MKPKESYVKNILQLIKKYYPEATISLVHKNPFQLLISTILSAQCTDIRVNIVTKVLFKDYKTPKDFAKINIKTLERYVKSTGFYRNKAKNIKATAKMILKDFNGKVPDEMEDLLKLPGVARKTANVVLGNAFNKEEGVVVDTHVGRISQRLKFTENKDPKKIEQDLVKIIPKKDWTKFSHLLIAHGRALCKAPTPICSKCFLNKICPYPKHGKHK